MKATFQTDMFEWSHWINHEVGKQYDAEMKAKSMAQQYATQKDRPVTVSYRHEGCTCTACDADGIHNETFHPVTI
ncbi:hypothetical protein ES703_12506 [subsurface metagenome]